MTLHGEKGGGGLRSSPPSRVPGSRAVAAAAAAGGSGIGERSRVSVSLSPGSGFAFFPLPSHRAGANAAGYVATSQGVLGSRVGRRGVGGWQAAAASPLPPIPGGSRYALAWARAFSFSW